jgi:hypothetical protein
MGINPAMARKMDGPRQAAEFLKENFSVDEQKAELQQMLKNPGLIPLAHGIAVELKIAEDAEMKEHLVESLKLSPEAVAVGYGGMVKRDVAERAAGAGKNAIFAQMGALESDDAN